jgi:hypothetical protein
MIYIIHQLHLNYVLVGWGVLFKIPVYIFILFSVTIIYHLPSIS